MSVSSEPADELGILFTASLGVYAVKTGKPLIDGAPNESVSIVTAAVVVSTSLSGRIKSCVPVPLGSSAGELFISVSAVLPTVPATLNTNMYTQSTASAAQSLTKDKFFINKPPTNS